MAAPTRLAAQGQVDRRLTPALFGSLIEEQQYDPTRAGFFFDDFLGYNELSSTGAFGKGPYYGFIENSSTIANVATEADGVVRVSTGATADNACGFTLGQIAGQVEIGVGVPGTLTSTGGRVAFEARLRFPDITDGDGSIFCGLASEGLAADSNVISDAHALELVDHVGFSVLDADNSKIEFSYNVASGTLGEVGEADVITATTTWYKVGFIYQPQVEGSKQITWYVDGDEQGTYITKATIASSAFPGGEEMAPYLLAKTDATATMRVDIDWWALAWEPTSIA
jgi:hypothetical protein